MLADEHNLDPRQEQLAFESRQGAWQRLRGQLQHLIWYTLRLPWNDPSGGWVTTVSRTTPLPTASKGWISLVYSRNSISYSQHMASHVPRKSTASSSCLWPVPSRPDSNSFLCFAARCSSSWGQPGMHPTHLLVPVARERVVESCSTGSEACCLVRGIAVWIVSKRSGRRSHGGRVDSGRVCCACRRGARCCRLSS